MGAPTNLSDRGAGEMSATAQMHAEPVMRLNQLTRWYVLSAFGALALYTLSFLVARLVGTTSILFASVSFLVGGVLLFFGGFSIKFLPSSLGGNPHVYSLGMALWSYWFLVGGTVVWFLTNALWYWAEFEPTFELPVQESWWLLGSSLGPLLVLIGTMLLMVNVYKTMERRV